MTIIKNLYQIIQVTCNSVVEDEKQILKKFTIPAGGRWEYDIGLLTIYNNKDEIVLIYEPSASYDTLIEVV